ncbi:MAG: preprotein translocase subunit SecE [Fibrobacteraceae bacterium]|jgi:preprotein translocase subunit SecE|nr:preprotein translocase subunit SecE [Fibrobacteraceae bacterium]MBQ5610178.1 preprotein translocase subunit SecE [Fibrobacteraceae bacterium]MEE1276985.1 preprotein translocase subunit SecE [Fibrobacteraceae bacterium]
MRKLQQYIKEVVQELKKVTWPTWEELKGSTLVVIIFSIIMGCYIAGLDFGLSWIIDKLLSGGGF